jgi:nucleoside-diphosphate-sugar epimerase
MTPDSARDSKRQILVTGGAGYMGSALVSALLSRGDHVTVVDKLLFGGEHLLPCFMQENFTFLRADVCQPGKVQEAVEQAQTHGAPALHAVVHLAAVVGFPACEKAGREESWRQNVEGVQMVFEQAEALRAERFLFASTYSVYGLASNGRPVEEDSHLHPQSLYAQTKIAAEEYLKWMASEARCAPLIYRFATLCGPSARMRFDLIVNQFVLEAFSRGELLVYQRDFSRSFVHIRDVVEGILLSLECPLEKVRGQVFNFGSEDGNYTKDEIVQLVCEALPKTKIRYDELSFSGDMCDVRVSYSRLNELLGFQATHTVKEGIDDVLRLLRSGVIKDPFSERYRNARLDIQ